MAIAVKEKIRNDMLQCPRDCKYQEDVKPDEDIFWRTRKWCRKYNLMLSSNYVVIRVFPRMVAIKGCDLGQMVLLGS